MTGTSENKPPIWFWMISGLALLWNGMGVGKFIADATTSAEDIAKLPQATQDMLASLPQWYMFAFGLAVIAGVLGCLSLLMRKKWAVILFVLSLLGVLAQQIVFWVMTDIGKNLKGGDLVMPILIPIVAIFLIWFARMVSAKNWLT